MSAGRQPYGGRGFVPPPRPGSLPPARNLSSHNAPSTATNSGFSAKSVRMSAPLTASLPHSSSISFAKPPPPPPPAAPAVLPSAVTSGHTVLQKTVAAEVLHEDMLGLDDALLARELSDFDFEQASASNPFSAGRQPSPPTATGAPQRQHSTDTVDTSVTSASITSVGKRNTEQSSSEVVALRQLVEQLKQANQSLLGEKEMLRKMHNQRQTAIEDLQDALCAADAEMAARIESATKELTKKNTMLQADVEYHHQLLEDKSQAARQLAQRVNKLNQQLVEKTRATAAPEESPGAAAAMREAEKLKQEIELRERQWQAKVAALEAKLTRQEDHAIHAPERLLTSLPSVGTTMSHALDESVKIFSQAAAVAKSMKSSAHTTVVQVQSLRFTRILQSLQLRAKFSSGLIEAILFEHTAQLLFLFGRQGWLGDNVRLRGDYTRVAASAEGRAEQTGEDTMGRSGKPREGHHATMSLSSMLPSTYIGFGDGDPAATSELSSTPLANAPRFKPALPENRTPKAGSNGQKLHTVSGAVGPLELVSPNRLVSPGILRQREALFGKGPASNTTAFGNSREMSTTTAPFLSRCCSLITADPTSFFLCDMLPSFREVLQGHEHVRHRTLFASPSLRQSEIIYVTLTRAMLGSSPLASIVSVLAENCLGSIHDGSRNPASGSLAVRVCAARVLLSFMVRSRECRQSLVPACWHRARPSAPEISIKKVGALDMDEIRAGITSLFSELAVALPKGAAGGSDELLSRLCRDVDAMISGAKTAVPVHPASALLQLLHDYLTTIKLRIIWFAVHEAFSHSNAGGATCAPLPDSLELALNQLGRPVMITESVTSHLCMPVSRGGDHPDKVAYCSEAIASALLSCLISRLTDAAKITTHFILNMDLERLRAPSTDATDTAWENLWLFRLLACISDRIPECTLVVTTNYLYNGESLDNTPPAVDIACLCVSAQLAFVQALGALVSRHDSFGRAAITGCYILQPGEAKKSASSPVDVSAADAAPPELIDDKDCSPATRAKRSNKSGKVGSLVRVSAEVRSGAGGTVSPLSGTKRKGSSPPQLSTPAKKARTSMSALSTEKAQTSKLVSSSNIGNLLLLPRLVDVLGARVQERYMMTRVDNHPRYVGRFSEYASLLDQLIEQISSLLREYPLRTVLENAAALFPPDFAGQFCAAEYCERLEETAAVLDALSCGNSKQCALLLRECLEDG